MSSRTWTPRAVASSAAPFAGDVWRAVEAQHVVSTRALVDTLDEQHVLERVLDDGKPTIPAGAARLHYLLFTPFRYAPPPGGSRFRGPDDAGVFYAADAVRTACAELGFWRWRHLLDVPALHSMPSKPQTVFRVKLATGAVDLREPPFRRDRETWTQSGEYAGCQRFGVAARNAGIGAIRYESVRDPEHGGCAALLSHAAFAANAPSEHQTWMLAVHRDRVVWRLDSIFDDAAFEFEASAWRSDAPNKPA